MPVRAPVRKKIMAVELVAALRARGWICSNPVIGRFSVQVEDDTVAVWLAKGRVYMKARLTHGPFSDEPDQHWTRNAHLSKWNRADMGSVENRVGGWLSAVRAARLFQIQEARGRALTGEDLLVRFCPDGKFLVTTLVSSDDLDAVVATIRSTRKSPCPSTTPTTSSP